ncbi:unnamed protein product, partial [Musa hybrid cultivar]
MRGQPASAPRLTAQPAASTPRPRAQPTRCLDPSGPCPASRLTAQLAASAPCAAATPAHPTRLRRATRSHYARDHTCVVCPPASHTCVVCPPASCYSIARCPRPHQRGLSAYVVLLGRSMPKATPARPARLRRATRSHDARDHTCVVCPPAPPLPKRGSPESCSSAPCRPRPHLRGQPACVVLLDSMPPETTPARPTRLRHAPRLQATRPIRCLGPSAPCAATRCLSSSADGATCCLGPMRGQPALAACCLGASAPCAATRFLGPKRSSSPLPWPLGHMRSQHAARCLGLRPHARLSEISSTRADLMRCLGSSASCAASSPLPRPLGPVRSTTLPRPLGTMRSKHAARCLGSSAPCAACPPEPPLPEPTSCAASAPRPHAWPAR